MAATGVIDRWPDFLTVEQAAAILRIGRTTAYALARHWLETGGAEGIPAIRVGKQLRVPRARLEAWHGGALADPEPRSTRKLEPVDPARPINPRARRPRSGQQSSRPFGA